MISLSSVFHSYLVGSSNLIARINFNYVLFWRDFDADSRSRDPNVESTLADLCNPPTSQPPTWDPGCQQTGGVGLPVDELGSKADGETMRV